MQRGLVVHLRATYIQVPFSSSFAQLRNQSNLDFLPISRIGMEGRREVIKMAMLESIGKREVEAMLNLVPGLKFHPTDEELIVHYLRYKVATNRIPVSIIGEVDLYKYDPWDLPEKAVFGQQEWYFFTLLDKRHPNGSRPSRAAGRGYWRATGADKPIISQQEGPDPIGIKKSLVFYHGKSPNGTKTDWIMHEYRLPNSSNNDEKGKGLGVVDDWVLCRLHNKKNGWQKNEVVQQQVDRHPDTCFTPTPDHVESPNKNGMNPNLSPQAETSSAYNSASTESEMLTLFKKYIDWYASLIVDDVPTSFEPFQPMVQAGLDTPMQDLCFPSVTSPF